MPWAYIMSKKKCTENTPSAQKAPSGTIKLEIVVSKPCSWTSMIPVERPSAQNKTSATICAACSGEDCYEELAFDQLARCLLSSRCSKEHLVLSRLFLLTMDR